MDFKLRLGQLLESCCYSISLDGGETWRWYYILWHKGHCSVVFKLISVRDELLLQDILAFLRWQDTIIYIKFSVRRWLKIFKSKLFFIIFTFNLIIRWVLWKLVLLEWRYVVEILISLFDLKVIRIGI